MRTALIFLSALVLLSATSSARATVIASFEQIPGALSANDMTPDGRYVVGRTDLDEDYVPDGTYIYDFLTKTMTVLPPEASDATAVSDDGTVVLGDMPDPESPDPELGATASIWRTETGWQSLGYLPNALECPSRSNGYELSADGTVAVGLSWYQCFGRAFRWTQATGMVQLEVLADDRNRASVISADGNLIGGFAQGTQTRTPTYWNGNGDGELLDPPDGNARGEVLGMNDAGTVMLGTWGTVEATNRAVKWTWNGSGWTREMLGTGSMGLPGVWSGTPMDMADDGTIVGFDFYLGNRIAWMLPNGAPPYENLRNYVNSHGGFVPVTTALEVCQAISVNGRRIIGHGAASRAWTVTLDLLGDMNCDGEVDFDDVEPFTQALIDPPAYEAAFSSCSIARANMNQDGVIDGLDISGFVADVLAP